MIKKSLIFIALKLHSDLQLSVIIVNYNVKYFLEHCLYAVYKAISAIKAEIIVIDNASSDGSMEYLLYKFPEVIFIDNPVNLGYAKANNQGLKQARGEYILFLNPDTIVPEDCFDICMRFLESHPKAGACGVRMLDGSGRYLPESKRAFPSLQTSFYKMSGLTKLFPQSKTFARYYLGHFSENEDKEVDVLSGAFFMVRMKVLKQTGGFDEQFFMYGEDIDLSYRIQQAGYVNYYLAATSIIHFKGESTKKGNLNYVRLFYKAMSIFVNKHFTGSGLQRLNFLIQGSIRVRAALSAATTIMKSNKAIPFSESIASMIVGNNDQIRKAVSILQKHKPGIRKISKKEPCGDLQKLILSTPPDEIVFCEGDQFSYKDIIAWIQRMPAKSSFKFFSKQAGSIIGSDFKNANGFVMV